MDGIEETLELVLEPPLRFEPTQVLVNRSGLYAALLGAGGELVVVPLPQSTRAPADGATPCSHCALACDLTAATTVVQVHPRPPLPVC